MVEIPGQVCSDGTGCGIQISRVSNSISSSRQWRGHCCRVCQSPSAKWGYHIREKEGWEIAGNTLHGFIRGSCLDGDIIARAKGKRFPEEICRRLWGMGDPKPTGDKYCQVLSLSLPSPMYVWACLHIFQLESSHPMGRRHEKRASGFGSDLALKRG